MAEDKCFWIFSKTAFQLVNFYVKLTINAVGAGGNILPIKVKTNIYPRIAQVQKRYLYFLELHLWGMTWLNEKFKWENILLFNVHSTIIISCNTSHLLCANSLPIQVVIFLVNIFCKKIQRTSVILLCQFLFWHGWMWHLWKRKIPLFQQSIIFIATFFFSIN